MSNNPDTTAASRPPASPQPPGRATVEHPVIAALRTVEVALDKWDLVAASWLPAASDEELQHALDEMDQVQADLEAFLLLLVLEIARRRSRRELADADVA